MPLGEGQGPRNFKHCVFRFEFAHGPQAGLCVRCEAACVVCVMCYVNICVCCVVCLCVVCVCCVICVTCECVALCMLFCVCTCCMYVLCYVCVLSVLVCVCAVLYIFCV